MCGMIKKNKYKNTVVYENSINLLNTPVQNETLRGNKKCF